MSSLADRTRGRDKPQSAAQDFPGPHEIRKSGSPAVTAAADPKAGATPDIATVLGGDWRDAAGARCFVVERRMEPARRHGCEAIGTMADWVRDGTPDAVLFASGAAATAPFVFF